MNTNGILGQRHPALEQILHLLPRWGLTLPLTDLLAEHLSPGTIEVNLAAPALVHNLKAQARHARRGRLAVEPHGWGQRPARAQVQDHEVLGLIDGFDGKIVVIAHVFCHFCGILAHFCPAPRAQKKPFWAEVRAAPHRTTAAAGPPCRHCPQAIECARASSPTRARTKWRGQCRPRSRPRARQCRQRGCARPSAR